MFLSFIGELTDAILVVSYDQLRLHVDEIKKIPGIGTPRPPRSFRDPTLIFPLELVVCDEGHRLKNAAIKTSLAVSELPTQRRIILSGTPIQNDLDEFYAMVPVLPSISYIIYIL